ncbi:octopamine receptor [Caerostris extrusa]|uniref:Octopamine receptor n=1 Tax=Caerostris extrusa TaxID=172846 RepID=A0AAV4VA46_CAEEX|nr:octopamine receptor [Caerostris extrusa]
MMARGYEKRRFMASINMLILYGMRWAKSECTTAVRFRTAVRIRIIRRTTEVDFQLKARVFWDSVTAVIHKQCLRFKLFHHGGSSRHSEHVEIILKEDVVEADNTTTDPFKDYPMSPEAVSTAVILAIIILRDHHRQRARHHIRLHLSPLQNVQNMFIVSLSVADITVAVLVRPMNIATPSCPSGSWDCPSARCGSRATSLCCTASYPAPLRHRPRQVLGDPRSHQLRQQETRRGCSS